MPRFKFGYCFLRRSQPLSPIGFLNAIDLLEGKRVSYKFQKATTFKSAKWENSTFKGMDFNFI